MAASWTCLRCKQQIASGMPSFLVVSGTFGGQGSKRMFDVDGGEKEGLCDACHELLKKGDFLSCAGEGCDNSLGDDDKVFCESCAQTAKLVSGARVEV